MFFIVSSFVSAQAGDTAYQWAMNMLQDEAAELLVKKGADKNYRGRVIVPEHIPKVKDFYDLPDGVDHPKPSMEYMEWQKEMDREREIFEQKQFAAWSAQGKPDA